MSHYFFNGVEMNEEDFIAACEEATDIMQEEESAIMAHYPGIDEECAGLICYLRSRSRWTLEKEATLVRMSRAGETLPNVLAGEF